MNPLQMGGVNVPFTEELFHQTKKMLKNSEAAKSALGETSDVYTPSAAAQQLPSSPQEKFLAQAKSEISKLDPNSEGFVKQAASALVDSALGQVFGSKIAKNPGYPQMNAKITQKLLDDYSDVIGEFLAGLVQAKNMGLSVGENDAEVISAEIADASYPISSDYEPSAIYQDAEQLDAEYDEGEPAFEEYGQDADYPYAEDYPAGDNIPDDADNDEGAYAYDDEELLDDDGESDYGDAEYYANDEDFSTEE
ncbi:MAG: hypothetical protein Q4F00_04995 [bacterium]|nr:hypothetical protein [bacterium]